MPKAAPQAARNDTSVSDPKLAPLTATSVPPWSRAEDRVNRVLSCTLRKGGQKWCGSDGAGGKLFLRFAGHV